MWPFLESLANWFGAIKYIYSWNKTHTIMLLMNVCPLKGRKWGSGDGHLLRVSMELSLMFYYAVLDRTNNKLKKGTVYFTIKILNLLETLI